MDFRLNSSEGKQILSCIRQGDYAHPGEEEAISISLGDITPSPTKRALDIGCGRGGTADWLRRQGWANVVGIDHDADAISYATSRYTKVSYFNHDVLELGQSRLGSFDLIYLFNSFYAFSEQEAALNVLRQVAAPKASLRIFDYAQATQHALPASLGSEIGKPIILDRVEEQLIRAGWQRFEAINLTDSYITWYGDFLQKLISCRDRIVEAHGDDWYDYFAQWYGALHQALIDGELQGVLIRASANQPSTDAGTGQLIPGQ